MSGTSLDGLDIVLVQFEENVDKIDHTIVCCEAVSYPVDLEESIKNAHELKIDQLLYLKFVLHQF